MHHLWEYKRDNGKLMDVMLRPEGSVTDLFGELAYDCWDMYVPSRQVNSGQ